MSSPRPTFPGPAVVHADAAVRHVWGDAQAGRVTDHIYVSSAGIHQLVFTLPPGAWFRHSLDNRTVFGADETYTVLEGVLLLANPETGEVHRLEAGETAFFRKDTWHHGLAEGPGPARVLEHMSPPPAAGTSQAYARGRPYLDPAAARYTQDRWLGRWPLAAAEAAAAFTMRVVRAADVLWRLEGRAQGAVVGLLASTEHLTAGQLRLPAGGDTGERRHGGDLGLYLRDGAIEAEAPPGTPLGRLAPGDGLFVPAGVAYRLRNPGAVVAEASFGVGGAYLAEGPS
jgi:quercetin dioxygenase-like cupin family protein